MKKELLGDALTRELKLIFNQDKVQKDFDNYVSAELTERVVQDGKTMVVCTSDNGNLLLFPEGVKVTVFAIVYQADIVNGYDDNRIRVCLGIGKTSTNNGFTSSEFGEAVFYYDESARHYSTDIFYYSLQAKSAKHAENEVQAEDNIRAASNVFNQLAYIQKDLCSNFTKMVDTDKMSSAILKKLENTLNEFTASNRRKGVKLIPGGSIKFGNQTYQYELKVFGIYGNYRLYGNAL